MIVRESNTNIAIGKITTLKLVTIVENIEVVIKSIEIMIEITTIHTMMIDNALKDETIIVMMIRRDTHHHIIKDD